MTQRLREAIDALLSLEDMPEEQQQHIAAGVMELVESAQNAPADEWGPAWCNLTRDERLADFRAWMATKTEGVGLPEEAWRRENIYD
ncbi:MAG: hypothetical protein R2834_24120 [Rhodothermales bacterium]